MAPFDSSTLDRMRRIGDPDADAVINAIYPGGHEAVSSLNKLLAKVERNDDVVPADAPEPVRAFLDAGLPIGRASRG